MDTRKDGFIDDVVDVLARKSGKLAAKGADHVETFKEAFKDGRRK
jgi:hypothetical protein